MIDKAKFIVTPYADHSEKYVVDPLRPFFIEIVDSSGRFDLGATNNPLGVYEEIATHYDELELVNSTNVPLPDAREGLK